MTFKELVSAKDWEKTPELVQEAIILQKSKVN